MLDNNIYPNCAIKVFTHPKSEESEITSFTNIGNILNSLIILLSLTTSRSLYSSQNSQIGSEQAVARIKAFSLDVGVCAVCTPVSVFQMTLILSLRSFEILVL